MKYQLMSVTLPMWTADFKISHNYLTLKYDAYLGGMKSLHQFDMFKICIFLEVIKRFYFICIKSVY